MNLILHQFKTDVRHFRRLLVALWLCFAAETALAGIHSVSGAGMSISHFLIELGQAIIAIVLVTSLVQADPLVGTGAAWLTRPVRREHLFWAKTAFIILCLFLPWLVFQGFGWALRGFSLHLCLAAAEESLLFSVTFVLVMAVLAALTRDLARFFLAVGITIGGIFAWAVAVEMLVHAGLLHQAAYQGWQENERSASALTVAWLVLAAGAFAAWISQARAGRWPAAVWWFAAGLLAFPVITTVWSKNFLAPKLMPAVPLTLSLVETNHAVFSEPQSQLLSSELALAGVPARHIAVIHGLSATIRFKGDRTVTDLPSYTPDANYSYGRRFRPNVSSQQNNYFGVVGDFFPADTIWFNDNFYGGVGSAFYDQDVLKRFPQGPPPGSLDGAVTVDLFGIKKVAEEPLRFATFQALPGLRVTIQKVRLAGDVIAVSLDECTARLMFDRDVNTASPGNYGGNEPFCTYVLYHPGSGEAFVVSQNNSREDFPALLSGDAHLALELRFPYPELRDRLAGVTAADWLREARLCVFAPVYAGSSRLAFHDENYVWPAGYDANVRHQKEKLDDTQAIARAALPANPTAAQLDAYLDDILLNVPDTWDQAMLKSVGDKLAALGTNGLPALLGRLPLAQDLENDFVFPAITKLAARDQLPELRAALQRDNHVVDVFVKKHWEADARDVLVAKLSDHREPFPPAALRLAAEAKDPATYADLRWHFVRLDYGQDRVLAALEQCPGFDTAAAVREAWQNARLGVINSGELAAIAAKQGLPDALNLAITHAENAWDPDTQQRDLVQLTLLTGYAGPATNTLPWLTANLVHLRYDEASQRYNLETPR